MGWSLFPPKQWNLRSHLYIWITLACTLALSCIFAALALYGDRIVIDEGKEDELRLPFAAAVDRAGRGVFAITNYQVGAVRTLLDLLRQTEDQR